MTIFLLSFFAIYGGVHTYLLCKVKGAFSLRGRGICLLSLWAMLMIAAPIAVRLLVRAGFAEVARPLAYTAYGWMGLLFYFVVIGLLSDGVVVVARLFSRFGRRKVLIRWSDRRLVLVSILLPFLLVAYGFFEARTIGLERVVLPTGKLPAGVARLKIVQISDLHLGLLIGRDRLRIVVEKIRQADPDILVATGDLVDGQGNNFTELARLLGEIRPKHGKFAVLGNHEFYAGLSHSLHFFKQAGFVVLRNQAQMVAGELVIAGVDDQRVATWPKGDLGAEAQLMAGLGGQARFVLFLKHRPQVEAASLGHFDLQLSGHVHQGQLFPFGMVVGWFYPFPVGVLHALAEGYIYVSRGAGTWGPPIRVLAPPEVTLIELVAAPGVAR